MQSGERELLSLLGSVNSLFAFLIAIAVLVLGLVVVRPLNKVAGLAFAGAGGGRIIGLGLDAIVDALQPKDADLSIIMLFNSIGTLIWIVTAIVFYGGIMFGSFKLANAHMQRGAS
ncbi:MAG: hypothetical protein IPM54_09090 [Polyangiaceae bacterium]|nr:hypothetical protein [Polyangiaceae bacterium]